MNRAINAIDSWEFFAVKTVKPQVSELNDLILIFIQFLSLTKLFCVTTKILHG